MIRSSLYHLATTNAPQLSSKLALQHVVKPAAVVLSGKLPLRSSFFSTRPKREQDDEGHHEKILVDAVDDSDATTTVPDNKTEATKPTFAEQALRRHFEPRRRWWPRFMTSGFDDDDFFGMMAAARDPFAPFFARPPPALFHRDPFAMMDDMMKNHHRRHRLMPILDEDKLPTSTTKDDDDMKLLRYSSPGYEIKESNDMYEIAIDIPKGVQKAADMKVELEQDGTVLHVSGERTVEDKESAVVSRTFFDQHFTLGPQLDTDALTANFADGVLVVKVPKLPAEETQSITITEKPHISDEEVLETNYSDAFDESDWAETGKTSHKEKA